MAADPFISRSLGIVRAGCVALCLAICFVAFCKLRPTGCAMVMVPFRDLGAVGTENQLLALKTFGVVDPPLFV